MPESGSADARFEAPENKSAKSERGPRDFWDKFSIVASLLIPASITVAGYLYSEASKQAEIQSTERIAAQQQVSSQIQARVGQAQLISTFMEALLSDNPLRQKLAIEAVLVALPEEGPRLVAIVSKDTSRPKAELAQVAQTSLDQRRSRLIDDAFSNDKATRIKATTELAQGWTSDDKLVPQLMNKAHENMANAAGLINSLVVLENVTPQLLVASKDDVRKVLDAARSKGPQTDAHVQRVEERLGSAKQLQ